ncbi:hypothetical protein [Moorena producens]
MRSRSVTSRSIASSCGLEMRSHLAVVSKCDHIWLWSGNAFA